MSVNGCLLDSQLNLSTILNIRIYPPHSGKTFHHFFTIARTGFESSNCCSSHILVRYVCVCFYGAHEFSIMERKNCHMGIQSCVFFSFLISISLFFVLQTRFSFAEIGGMEVLRAFVNSPIGPKTTHFWGPVFNWSLPIAVFAKNSNSFQHSSLLFYVISIHYNPSTLVSIAFFLLKAFLDTKKPPEVISGNMTAGQPISNLTPLFILNSNLLLPYPPSNIDICF